MKTRLLSLTLFIAMQAGAAGAQIQQQFVLGGAGNVQIAPDQKMMFDAENKMVHRDFAGADQLYGQVIAINGRNIEAYLQRAVTRREMGNLAGMDSDARIAITLSNDALQQNPNDPNLYYQRGMGFRLLKSFDQAEKDIRYGMQIGGKGNWDTDLKAIEMERKEAKQ